MTDEVEKQAVERKVTPTSKFFSRIAYGVLALAVLSGFIIERQETQHRVDQICQARKDARADTDQVLLSIIELFPSTPETDQIKRLVTDRPAVHCP